MTSFLSIGLFVSSLCVCIYRVSAAPPSPPDDVRLQQCNSRRAHITWQQGNDNGSPITRYYVEYNTSYAPTNWFKATTVPADVTEATVQTSPFANYTFRVVAQNREGESQPSQPTLRVCMTNPDTPYKNPRHVHTDRSKPGFLIVKWDPMPEIEQNGPGFRYIVTTRIDGMSETMMITDWRQNQMEINYHRIYYPVEIKVEAANALGNSVQPAPVIIGYTGEDYPNVIPSNFELVPGKEMTATSAWFQWDPVDPSPEAMRGEFHGYKIRIWKGDDRDTNYREVLIPRAPSRGLGTSHGNPEIEKEMAVVQNLYPHSVVHVDIVAVNTYYASLPSNPVTIQTPEGETRIME